MCVKNLIYIIKLFLFYLYRVNPIGRKTFKKELELFGITIQIHVYSKQND